MGYDVAACLSGYMMDLWSQGEIYNSYTPMLILTIVFICIDQICCIKLEFRLESESTRSHILKDVFALLKSKPIVIFLCFVTFSGFLNSIKHHFLLWQNTEEAWIWLYFYTWFCMLRDSAGINISIPKPVMDTSDRINHARAISYALSLTTIIGYANVVTPPGASGTIQGLIQGMHDSFGLSIGSLIGGILYKKFGGTMTLRIYSVFAAFSGLTYFILYSLYLKYKTPDLCNNVKWKTPDDARRYCVTAEA